VHFEIGCKDSAKTQEFYKKLFDWKIEAMGSDGIGGNDCGRGWRHHRPHHRAGA
jgi:predicted enzyme related to lactoylglutathione lyase